MNHYERFKKFHKAFPEVYQLFLDFAKAAAPRRLRFGARMIWERLRWYTQIETPGFEFKLNDHHAPYYARLAMLEFPEELKGLFELRRLSFEVSDEQMKKDLLDNKDEDNKDEEEDEEDFLK